MAVFSASTLHRDKEYFVEVFVYDFRYNHCVGLGFSDIDRTKAGRGWQAPSLQTT